ncbi:MAG TPA: histone deacetylase [Anaerolineae bacterium]|nr:histone deacetylase [Anaerolineae bacterium]
MPSFATYLYPHTCYTSKPADQIRFVGHSYPHFNQIRVELEKVLADYPTLVVREAEYSDYLRVHTREYLSKLRMMAAGEHVEELPRLSIECTGFEYCLPGYLYGLGGMLEAIDQMRVGALERAYCFSLGGHHAYADWGHGYCLLNPQAAAARYAQTRGFQRVLIVDWDIHHGDGTQSIFANDPSVYCISIHSGLDMYMALTRVMAKGTTTAGEEVGHCNIPLLNEFFENEFFEEMSLPGRFYRAAESLSVFGSALEQIPWIPDLIFIFSGYDSHKDDCGKGITNWTNQEYKTLTKYVIELAKRANCPILSVHGGGYKLPVTIPAAVSHVEVLAGGSGLVYGGAC